MAIPTKTKYYDGKPGEYFCHCIYCKVDFIGDKRDFWCGDCQPPKCKSSTEKVLCFRREALEALGVFQGLTLAADDYLPAILQTTLRYIDRPLAELDTDYKQLIPYVIVVCGDRVLEYQRCGGENRLLGKWSLGIGGHINEDDGPTSTAYNTGLHRELREEIGYEMEQWKSPLIVALINDDSTPVGKVHFGVVHILNVESTEVVTKCPNLKNAHFVSMRAAELRRMAGEYEKWSELAAYDLPLLIEMAK